MRARTRLLARVGCAAVLPGAAIALAALALPAFAQFPDVLSQSECPGCAARLTPAPFDGVWSSALTAGVETGWELAQFFCFAACTSEGRAVAERLLAGSETAHRSAPELYPLAVAANVRSVERISAETAGSRSVRLPGFSCERLGFAAQVVSPLPLQIETEADRVLLRYEELGVVRTISLNGPVAPAHGARAAFGMSTGRFEHGALVVDTRGILAGRLSEWLGGLAHSDALRAVERYSVSADGRWLDLTLTLDDPATFVEPLVVTKRWLRTPRARIMHHGCDVMSTGLSGVFAEYLDPSIIEARR
jgi:hypothetical protein